MVAFFRRKSGFTLVEVVVVAGLTAAIGTFLIFNLLSRRGTTELKSTASQMTALLGEAQSRSMSQASGYGWGVHFENSTSTGPFYALFHTTYSSANQTGYYRLPSTIGYVSSNLPAGSSRNVVFDQITGRVPTSTTIQIYQINRPDDSYTISVDAFGAPSYTAGVGGQGAIDSTYRYAWSGNIGWLDFYGSGTVRVNSIQLSGYATNTNVGQIALDCATTSSGNVCATSDFRVTNNSSGALAGWAWNDQIGWVSFSCSNSGTCGTLNYGVTIDNNGYFHGWAWSGNVGWISFSCENTGTCGASDYKIRTTWRPS